MKIRNHTPATGPAIRLCSCVREIEPAEQRRVRQEPAERHRPRPAAQHRTASRPSQSACRDCRSRYRVPKARRHDRRCRDRCQHRVVEHLGELEAGRQDHDQQQDGPDRQPTAARPASRTRARCNRPTSRARRAASHGFRGPGPSETAPSNGASSATQTPTIVFAKLQASCPRTGSPITTFAKYGGNTNTYDQTDVRRARELEQRPGELSAQIGRRLAGRGQCGIDVHVRGGLGVRMSPRSAAGLPRRCRGMPRHPPPG